MKRNSFCLEGEFVGFEPSGKSPFKYLQLKSGHQIHRIKLSKAQQLMLFRYLLVGDCLRVVGEQKEKEGDIRLKATEVTRIAEIAEMTPDPVPVPPAKFQPDTVRKPSKRAAKILICNKSSCRKRGSETVCQAVEMALAQAGLEDRIEIKLTGCMDRCKAGPNVVVLPDKEKYTRVSPNQTSSIVQHHFGYPDVADAAAEEPSNNR